MADSGIGIDSDQQQDVFTRFKRLMPAYEGIYPGAGLGLSIIKQLIDDVDGEIYVESTPQQGSTFTCVIPLKAALLDDISGVDETEFNQLRLAVRSENYSSKTTHLLLVEDEAIAAKVTAYLFESLNCKLDMAKDYRTALAYAKHHKYDLIVTDIGLPDGSGNELAKEIRLFETSKNRRTPIIALTAHVDPEDQAQYLEAGIDAVVLKPLTREIAVDICLKKSELPD